MIKNIDWPTTERFVEGSITKPPVGIIKELTIQYWFEKIEWRSMQTQIIILPQKLD